MTRRVLPFPVLVALLLLTALASGIAQGQMARDGVFSALGICSDDAEMAAPCLDCALAGGLPGVEGVALADRVAGAEAVGQPGDLVVAARGVTGGGARAPPGWVWSVSNQI